MFFIKYKGWLMIRLGVSGWVIFSDWLTWVVMDKGPLNSCCCIRIVYRFLFLSASLISTLINGAMEYGANFIWCNLHTNYYYNYNHFTAVWYLSGTTLGEPVPKRSNQNQSGFPGARDSEWQWYQLGHMQICTSSQTDNLASTPLLIFYRSDALPATQPTASKHWRQVI